MGQLSPAARSELLSIARSAITEQLAGRRYTPPKPNDEALCAAWGAFVTLSLRGALRGCIGSLESADPLYRTVAAMARSAAFHDPRFPALTAEEWPDISLEISVLGPMRRITEPAQIQVGSHGLLISAGGQRGVLLPQVATKYGWDRTTFLEQTCQKAGLPPDAWRHGADISVFEADVFGEEEDGSG